MRPFVRRGWLSYLNLAEDSPFLKRTGPARQLDLQEMRHLADLGVEHVGGGGHAHIEPEAGVEEIGAGALRQGQRLAGDAKLILRDPA